MRPSLRLIIIAIVGLAAWETATEMRILPAFLFPKPTDTAAWFADALVRGDLLVHIGATLRRLFSGFVLGASAAPILGFAVGLSRRVGDWVDPIVRALHPVPKIALYPFLLVFLGVGEASLTLVPALSAFFPLFINTASGVRQIRPVYLDLVRVCGGRKWDRLRHVALPGSLPNILAGARISLNSALVVTIGVEMLSSQTGLGGQLWLSREILRLEMMWSLLFLVSAIGSLLTLVMNGIGRWLAPWTHSID